jgi:hypothetical protein
VEQCVLRDLHLPEVLEQLLHDLQENRVVITDAARKPQASIVRYARAAVEPA